MSILHSNGKDNGKAHRVKFVNRGLNFSGEIIIIIERTLACFFIENLIILLFNRIFGPIQTLSLDIYSTLVHNVEADIKIKRNR